MIKKLRFNYLHIICISLTLFFLACIFLVFPGSIGRIIESCRDFGLSIGFYFAELFHIPHNIVPTINNLPKVPFWDIFLPITPTDPVIPSVPLPETFDGFFAQWSAYWHLWINKNNFFSYLTFLSELLYFFSQFIMLVIPFILVIYILFKRYMQTENNDYNKDSKPLKAFKNISKYTYRPIKQWLISFLCFVREHKFYYVFWVCIWLFNFNIFTVFLEFIAFYLYFVTTFDVGNLYIQFYKLFIDLSVVFTFFPVWCWVIVGLVVFDIFRKKIAYSRLNHYEMQNRGFINARPIVYMVCGTMGKKKTTAITDMSLSQEIMFRDKAFEKILENDLKFPLFPWITLENEIKYAMEHHEVYNLATCRKFVSTKAIEWEKTQCYENLFGYNYDRYGFTYDDKLKTIDIWNVINIYSQLYFIYIVQSSLLISNYSVRTDNVLAELGNFPMWNSNFFKRDSRLLDSYSRHAHILDFDSLRLGRKVLEKNKNANNFEFGVVLITEIGKERGNSLENQEKKKKDETTNQKNDLFNSWLKMVRHSATVDNFPFVRVITDEQRPESWGADARDLCEIIHIRDSGETRLAMPFFSLAELLYYWLFGKLANIYYQYRYVRSDNTLLMYILKTITAKMHHYYTHIYNRFGYCKLSVQIESGTQDGQIDENKYYLMSKKIYSKRFSTDCFSDFFTKKALRASVGIDDLREYKTEKATFDELKEQNSYFINDLLNGFQNDKTDKH